MCPWKPFWLATDLAICRWLTSVQIVCEVGLGIRKGRWRLAPGQIPAQDGHDEALRQAREGRLLLQQAAVFLHSAVPAAGFHAERLPQTAIGDAGRYRAAVGAPVAGRNAGFLLAAAPHGGRDCRRLHTEQAQANQHRGNKRIGGTFHASIDIILSIECFQQINAQDDLALNQTRVPQRG